MNRRLTENFVLNEFVRSSTARRLSIDNTPSKLVETRLAALCIDMLQPARDYFTTKYGRDKVRIKVNSELLECRRQARKNRDFAEADRIRDQLTGAGLVLEDTSDGTRWRRR